MIYVVRHGETDANQSNIIRGSYFDDELNEIGLAQAKATAIQLGNINFDVCYCSPLKRTMQTCEPIYDGEIILDKRLLPRDYGELIKLGVTAEYLDEKGYWNRGLNRPVENGENMLQLEARVRNLLDEIPKKHPKQNVLIVTHGSLIAVMKAILDNYSRGPECRLYKAGNCEIVTIPN